ncbi:hypothetical protein QOZ95_004968 [Paenibacillus brasilensis]|uniref:Transposase n=1 Tax=Paenibacillus brasilensis TaxID=128574 RepID=A0ABU0L644_9BACL|nr:hypothetical protein [Paenibacillus brasilensis]
MVVQIAEKYQVDLPNYRRIDEHFGFKAQCR